MKNDSKILEKLCYRSYQFHISVTVTDFYFLYTRLIETNIFLSLFKLINLNA